MSNPCQNNATCIDDVNGYMCECLQGFRGKYIGLTHSAKNLKKSASAVGQFTINSSEIRGLRSTKCSSEMLQNLLYFMYMKTHVVFFVFHFVQLYVSP